MTTTQSLAERMALGELLRLDGKTAVITGGAKGIGNGIARRFAEAGAHVIIGDRSQLEAAEAAQALAGQGEYAGFPCDVAQEVDIVDLFRKTEARFGGVDILVNNAGIYPFRPVQDLSSEQWDRIQAVNLRGAFLMSREFARSAIRRGEGGAIVNIGSIDSFHPSMPGLSAYDASKGGMLMLTKALALELAPRGIRVNLIAPGGITTEGSTAGLGGLTQEQLAALQRDFVAKIPLGRMGVPDDIARVALFLASPASAYMTGAAVVVDGGRLVR